MLHLWNRLMGLKIRFGEDASYDALFVNKELVLAFSVPRFHSFQLVAVPYYIIRLKKKWNRNIILQNESITSVQDSIIQEFRNHVRGHSMSHVGAQLEWRCAQKR